jgi:hypothetical protein
MKINAAMKRRTLIISVFAFKKIKVVYLKKGGFMITMGMMLGSCGFTPTLKDPSSSPRAAQTINHQSFSQPTVLAIDVVRVEGKDVEPAILHIFRQRLRTCLKGMKVPANQQFLVRINTISDNIGYAVDGSSLRSQQQLVARIEHMIDGKPQIYAQEENGIKDYLVVDSITSYSQTSSDALSNMSAQAAATGRLMTDLAVQVRSLLLSMASI